MSSHDWQALRPGFLDFKQFFHQGRNWEQSGGEYEKNAGAEEAEGQKRRHDNIKCEFISGDTSSARFHILF
jgi:hypothetical protein